MSYPKYEVGQELIVQLYKTLAKGSVLEVLESDNPIRYTYSMFFPDIEILPCRLVPPELVICLSTPLADEIYL